MHSVLDIYSNIKSLYSLIKRKYFFLLPLIIIFSSLKFMDMFFSFFMRAIYFKS